MYYLRDHSRLSCKLISTSLLPTLYTKKEKQPNLDIVAITAQSDIAYVANLVVPLYTRVEICLILCKLHAIVVLHSTPIAHGSSQPQPMHASRSWHLCISPHRTSTWWYTPILQTTFYLSPTQITCLLHTYIIFCMPNIYYLSKNHCLVLVSANIEKYHTFQERKLFILTMLFQLFFSCSCPYNF